MQKGIQKQPMCRRDPRLYRYKGLCFLVLPGLWGEWKDFRLEEHDMGLVGECLKNEPVDSY